MKLLFVDQATAVWLNQLGLFFQIISFFLVSPKLIRKPFAAAEQRFEKRIDELETNSRQLEAGEEIRRLIPLLVSSDQFGPRYTIGLTIAMQLNYFNLFSEDRYARREKREVHAVFWLIAGVIVEIAVIALIWMLAQAYQNDLQSLLLAYMFAIIAGMMSGIGVALLGFFLTDLMLIYLAIKLLRLFVRAILEPIRKWMENDEVLEDRYFVIGAFMFFLGTAAQFIATL